MHTVYNKFHQLQPATPQMTIDFVLYCTASENVIDDKRPFVDGNQDGTYIGFALGGMDVDSGAGRKEKTHKLC